MVYNKAIYEGFVADTAEVETVSPMQFAIEATQMDQNLFSALIEMDIAEAASGKQIISLSEEQIEMMKEASSNGIVDKIKSLIEKFKAAIKALFNKFFTWVSNLVSNDDKLYEKYAKYITDAKVGECPIKGDTVDVDQYNKAMEAIDTITNAAIASTQNTDNVAAVKKNIGIIEKNIETITSVNIVDSNDKPIAQKVVLNNIIESVKTGYKNKTSIAKATMAKTENLIRNAQKDAEIAQREAQGARNVERANKCYEAISKTLSLFSKASSAYIRIMNQSIAIDRANFIKLGNWALKGGDVKKESTVYDEMQDMMLDIANEQYCEASWEIA